MFRDRGLRKIFWPKGQEVKSELEKSA